jgi:hypothetical protein
LDPETVGYFIEQHGNGGGVRKEGAIATKQTEQKNNGLY